MPFLTIFPTPFLTCISNHDHRNHSFPLVEQNTTFSQVHYVMNNDNVGFYSGPNWQAHHLIHVSLPIPSVYPNETISQCSVVTLGTPILLYSTDTSLFLSIQGIQVKRTFISTLIGLPIAVGATSTAPSTAGFVKQNQIIAASQNLSVALEIIFKGHVKCCPLCN